MDRAAEDELVAAELAVDRKDAILAGDHAVGFFHERHLRIKLDRRRLPRLRAGNRHHVQHVFVKVQSRHLRAVMADELAPRPIVLDELTIEHAIVNQQLAVAALAGLFNRGGPLLKQPVDGIAVALQQHRIAEGRIAAAHDQ
jgi:hypothetical protein